MLFMCSSIASKCYQVPDASEEACCLVGLFITISVLQCSRINPSSALFIASINWSLLLEWLVYLPCLLVPRTLIKRQEYIEAFHTFGEIYHTYIQKVIADILACVLNVCLFLTY